MRGLLHKSPYDGIPPPKFYSKPDTIGMMINNKFRESTLLMIKEHITRLTSEIDAMENVRTSPPGTNLGITLKESNKNVKPTPPRYNGEDT
jgi:hypothetical protein